MPWGRLDDGLYDHPKLDVLGRSKLPAVGLWTLSISWSNRRLTDGFIPSDRVLALGGTRQLAEALVTAGMFDRGEGGYVIHDFLTFNDSREQVESRREADRNRKRKAAGLPPEARPETDRTPEPRAPARDRAGRVPPAGLRPDPTDSEVTPQPPASGGRPSRANGTSPRAKADAAADLAELESRAKKHRRQQRELAYYRGEITETQMADMNARDAALTELPVVEHPRIEGPIGDLVESV